jgi:hypothetical protein
VAAVTDEDDYGSGAYKGEDLIKRLIDLEIVAHDLAGCFKHARTLEGDALKAYLADIDARVWSLSDWFDALIAVTGTKTGPWPTKD